MVIVVVAAAPKHIVCSTGLLFAVLRTRIPRHSIKRRDRLQPRFKLTMLLAVISNVHPAGDIADQQCREREIRCEYAKRSQKTLSDAVRTSDVSRMRLAADGRLWYGFSVAKVLRRVN